MKRRYRCFSNRAAIFILVACFFISLSIAQNATDRGHDHTIKLSIDGEEWNATLNESSTSRDFIKIMPLYITFKDYAGTQKVSGLPESLSTWDAPGGSEASAGDIAYYAPWGNVAVFHEDVEYTRGLVIMGHIDENLEALLEILTNNEAVDVRIDLIE